MAIQYHFDLYPRDDPRDGTKLVRFTKLQSAEYRGEANGTGAGRFSLRADTTDAGFIDPAGLQYVRVIREDTVAVTEVVVGGFFLDSGDFTALDEKGTRLLTFGGAGTLSYLSRSIMASHTYANAVLPSFFPQDPYDDTWRLYAQSTVYAGGSFLGAMLWRVLIEAQNFTPGTHRHVEGVNVTDTHDDDRPESALPDLTLGFDQFSDSGSNAWAVSSGEFKAQVGENVLQVVKRLMEAGLYVEMDPDTFELNAYPAGAHRRTRTGASWGAAVIRFQSPTSEDITTGNIKSDAKRAIAAFIKRSWLLAGGNDVYGDDTGTSDIPWEGFYHADVNDAAAAAGIADIQLGARDDAGDTVRLRIRLGTTPTTGYYLPFEHILLDDLCTVHTGSGQWDFNEQTFPVAALTVSLRPGGDWDCWVDLGSSYSAAATRQFQVAPVPAHTHPPNPQLCQPGTTVTPVFEEGYADASQAGPSFTFGLDVDGTADTALFVLSAEDESEGAGHVAFTSVQWRPSGTSSPSHNFTKVYGLTDGVQVWMLVDPPAATDSSALVICNSSTGHTRLIAAAYVSIIDPSSPYRAIDVATGTGTATAITASAQAGDLVLNLGGQLQNDVDGSLAVPTAGGGQTSIGTDTENANAGQRDGSMGFGRGSSSPTWTFNGSRPWWAVALVVKGESTAGDLPQDIGPDGSASTGTSNRASRCDHVHEHGYLESGGPYHTADQITGLSSATGSLPWFVVTDATYGATGDGSTDDATAINAAIAALNTAGGGVLYFPATASSYLVSAGLTSITVPCIVRGDGLTSKIVCSSATANLFTSASNEVHYRDLFLDNSATTPTAGAAIRVTSGNLARYSNVAITDFWIGIDHEDGVAWSMDHLYIQSVRKYGIQIDHATPDFGDWSIDNTVISDADGRSADAAIRIDASGGGKITNLKVNGSPGTGYNYGIDLVLAGGDDSSVFVLSNNSIENTRNDSIHVATGAGSVLTGLIIDGLETYVPGNTGYAVNLVSNDTAGIEEVIIDGLLARTDGTAREAIVLTNVDNVALGEIVMFGYDERYTQTSSTNIQDSGAGASALDDLSDVVITAVAANDALMYAGGSWVNSGLRWEPVVTDPGSGPELVFDGTGDIVMTFVDYS